MDYRPIQIGEERADAGGGAEMVITFITQDQDEMTDPLTNVVRVTVSNLRKKLGEPPLISTVPGRGYRLEE